jgi:hypothetical protein
MAKKSWRQKLEAPHEVKVVRLEKPYAGLSPGAKLLLPTPRLIQDYVSRIPAGSTVSVPTMRADLAAEHQADGTCPLVTGIFLRVVAEVAWEEIAAGAKPSGVSPFWRAIEPGSALARKITCGEGYIESQRQAEQ